MTTFFFRFYSQSSEKITECINKLREFSPEMVELSRGPVTATTNLFVLPTDVEVTVSFPNEQDKEAFKANQAARKLYTQYAYGPKPLDEIIIVEENKNTVLNVNKGDDRR